MNNNLKYLPIRDLLIEIIDNRGKSVPTVEKGFPLIATNCIKHSSIYPTFDKVRYVDESTMKNWFRAHLKPNDILFVNKGTPGRVCLVPNPVTFCAAQDMMGFRCNDELINYKYLFAVLRSNEIQKTIENNHVGLVIPHFRKQDLSSLLIPIKSRQEQDSIGNLYICLSEKIELNNRINAELEAMAKTLYDYWFVQFDFPFDFAQGKPNAKGKPYKSSGGKMVWNEELKNKQPLSITDPAMNRYFIHIDEAVDFILQCLPLIKIGEVFIPKLKTYNIKDMASKISKNHKIIGVRKGEKIEEVLITHNEQKHAIEKNNMWIITPDNN